MTPRKIELMHWYFGVDHDHKCGECSNLVEGRYHDKTLRKCSVYGLTHSQASDWVKRYTACGMFGKEWHGNAIIKLVKHRRKDNDIAEPMDGQIEME